MLLLKLTSSSFQIDIFTNLEPLEWSPLRRLGLLGDHFGQI